MAEPPDEQEPKPEDAEPKPPAQESPEASLRGLANAFKRFLVAFLFSWGVAYVGSARGIEWLYFTGLGGVTVSMLALLVWLIS
jgi:hypothetical protein